MIIIENFSQVVAQIESERGIDKDIIVDAIEKSLISAAKKKYSNNLDIHVEINSDTGESRLWSEKKVVIDYSDENENEILITDAKKLNQDAETGDILEFEFDIQDFGRIATQTAKQVILQCIREAEKNLILNEFSDKIGQIITGTIQNIEGNTYLVNLGKIESFLPPKEQTPGEIFNVKDRIKIYIVDIHKTNKGPIIKISRTHSGLIRELFKLEVPEIQDGIIEIKNISRVPGKRTKIAVKSSNSNISSVGTCVGHMGGRIQSILKEINNEKIDILEWAESPEEFIANSLKPATVTKVEITNPNEHEATVIVPDDQLSLAIGKSGLNVRLAVKLTNWKLDIISDSDYAKKENTSAQSLEERIKASQTKPKTTDTPETDTSETDTSETDTSETDTSETDTSETDASETDTPETDTSETDASETDASETDTPETDASETDTPETDASETSTDDSVAKNSKIKAKSKKES